MNSEKSKIYLFSFFMPACLLFTLLVPSTSCRIAAALVLAIFAGVALALIKKRSIPSINHRQVTGLLAVIAVVYTVMFYMLGIWLGFYRSAMPLSGKTLVQYVLPAALIIVATELIRDVLLAQKKTLVSVMAYVIGIMSELALGYGLSGVSSLSQFMDIVGLTLFPAITANLLYHYLVRRYGATSSIVYRLLLTLPASFFPIYPAISDVLNSFLLVILPLLVQAFVDLLYEKRVRYASRSAGRWSFVSLTVTVLCMVATVMLISGQFRYRLLVIATPSMTGELNVGDAVIWEKYDGDLIEEGDVVVFTKTAETMVVHRVVKIQRLNGEVYYTTKGDANDSADPGYITAANIEGIVRFKVSHIGHPSLWLRDLFS